MTTLGHPGSLLTQIRGRGGCDIFGFSAGGRGTGFYAITGGNLVVNQFLGALDLPMMGAAAPLPVCSAAGICGNLVARSQH